MLRDAHQSLIATRMTMDEMMPALEMLDDIGFSPWSAGAALHLMPASASWTKIRGSACAPCAKMPQDKAPDVVPRPEHAWLSPLCGRCSGVLCSEVCGQRYRCDPYFDALNDIRNLETAIKAAKKEGAHIQPAISFTTGPVFDTQYFVNYAKQLESAGADSICIKDMAGLLTPYYTTELVTALKENIKVPIQIHSHYTSGLASMVHLKAIEAGADGIDTAMSPLALGTSHPATESMVAALAGTEYDTGLDLKKLSEIRDYFNTLREKYLKEGLLNPKMLGVDANALLYQVPGGMLSNLVSQLKQAGKEDQLEEVLKEVPRVREDSGYPPLVTPTSQIVGTQAVFNIIMGERYKMVTKEFKDMVAGKYGKTPVEIDPAFREKICGDEPIIDCRPADLLKPELESLKDAPEVKEFAIQDEDVLSFAQFGQVAVKFFEKRRNKQLAIDGEHLDMTNKVHPV